MENSSQQQHIRVCAQLIYSAIAVLARRMATDHCEHLEAYTSSTLVPLDKQPGCPPIWIGEVLSRITGKAIMEVVKEDVEEAVGNLEVCAGQQGQAGCEAAVHAMIMTDT